MRVTVIGAGYVGLVSGACLAEMGNDVLCMDVDPRKIDTLAQGEMKKLGVEVSDLDGAVRKAGRPATKKKAPGAGTRPPVPVKYRNAETGDTWTGRGRTPTWLAALEAQGRKREEFLVAK